jgi:hypothetical protein
MVPSLSQEHQRIIGCNCSDPGPKAALGAKSCQMPEYAHHSVLKNILCVFKIANDPPNSPLQKWPVAAVQLHECVLIATFGC